MVETKPESSFIVRTSTKDFELHTNSFKETEIWVKAFELLIEARNHEDVVKQ